MTDKQSEALRRADMLENWNYKRHSDLLKAAAELRRLDALNAELVEALRAIALFTSETTTHEWAKAALAKAEGK